MITIDAERCNGCGACIEVCPDAALYLIDGKAMVDRVLCRDCEACIAACPTDAIAFAGQILIPETIPGRVPVVRPKPEVIQVRMRPLSVPLRTKMLPVVGAALAWAGREIVPRVVDYGLDRLIDERRVAGSSGRAPNRDARASTGAGGGRRHQHRKRGG